MRLLQNQISRRSVRKAREDELKAFGAWVNQTPARDSSGLISSKTDDMFDWDNVIDEDTDDGGGGL
jgi:hypothetical protein